MGFAVRWFLFRVVCDALQRLLALRDECRHVTTLHVAHLRRLALEIGRRAARVGALAAPDDIFFVRWEELPYVLTPGGTDWRRRAAERRRERAENERAHAPDLLGGKAQPPKDNTHEAESNELVGLGVSPAP